MHQWWYLPRLTLRHKRMRRYLPATSVNIGQKHTLSERHVLFRYCLKKFRNIPFSFVIKIRIPLQQA